MPRNSLGRGERRLYDIETRTRLDNVPRREALRVRARPPENQRTNHAMDVIPYSAYFFHNYASKDGFAAALQEVSGAVMASLYNDGALQWLPVGHHLRVARPSSVPPSRLWLGVSEALPNIAEPIHPLVSACLWQVGAPVGPPGPRLEWFEQVIWKPGADANKRIKEATDARVELVLLAMELAVSDFVRPQALPTQAMPAAEGDVAPAALDADHPSIATAPPARAYTRGRRASSARVVAGAVAAEQSAPRTPAGVRRSTQIPPPAPAWPPLPPPRVLDRRDTTVEATSARYVPVSQVQGILVAPRKGVEEIHDLAIAAVVEWLREKKRVAVPVDWRDRSSWEVGTDTGAQQVWWETDGNHVAMRFDEPCAELAGRHWRVEFVLATSEGNVLVGTRLSVLVHRGIETTVHPTIPGLVRRLNHTLTLVADATAVVSATALLEVDHDVARLAALIRDRHRTIAVVVIHTDSADSPQALAAGELATRVVGAAHVVMIGTTGLLRLEAELGPAGEVPRGGVRLYGRQFDPDLASVRCPVVPGGSLWPARETVTELAGACVAATVSVQDAEIDLPSFAQIRQLIARERRRHDLARLASANDHVVDELAGLRAALAQAEQDAVAAEGLAIEQQHRAEDKEEELRNTLARLMIAEDRIKQLQDDVRSLQVAGEPLPATWDTLARWTLMHFGDRVAITSGALRAARASVFDNIPFVAEIIALMGQHYWIVRTTGAQDARAALVSEQERLRVEISPVGDAINNAKLRGQYQTVYQGRRYTLDMHVSGSSSRDRRRGFRLYYTWSEHLDNSHT